MKAEAQAVPHLYGSVPLDDNLRFGLAVTEPFVNGVHYDRPWSGRYVSTRTIVGTTDINAAIAYDFGDHLSIGGGVSYQRLKLTLSSLIPQFPIFGAGTPDGGFLLNASNWNWGYDLSVMAEPADGWRLGLTYRSAVSHNLAGQIDFDPATRIGFVSAHGHVPITLPASVTFGATRTWESLTLSAQAELTEWHVLQNVSLAAPPNPVFTYQERFRDSWMYALGATWQFDPVWALNAGIGFDQSPVADAYRDTGVPDKGRTMLGAGAGVRLSEALSLELGYAYYISAHASMDSSVNAVDPITGVTLKGGYDNGQHNVTLSLKARL